MTDFNTDTALHMPASFDTLTGHKLTVMSTKSVLKSKALGFGSVLVSDCPLIRTSIAMLHSSAWTQPYSEAIQYTSDHECYVTNNNWQMLHASTEC